MKCFKHIAILLLVIVAVVSCKKETAPTPEPAKAENPYFGSKDGPYSRNFRGRINNSTIPTTGYIKYGSDAAPTDGVWDEVKPSGWGNYVRFDSLNYGTYYVLLKNDSLESGVIVELNQASHHKLDITLPLRKF